MNNMKKVMMISLLALLLVGSVLAYTCIGEEDNEAVKEFKSKMNTEALRYDIEQGVTQEASALKIKYFTKCD